MNLEKFSNHNKFEYAIKVSKNNYGYNPEQKLLTIPFYFIPFVAKDLAAGKRHRRAVGHEAGHRPGHAFPGGDRRHGEAKLRHVTDAPPKDQGG